MTDTHTPDPTPTPAPAPSLPNMAELTAIAERASQAASEATTAREATQQINDSIVQQFKDGQWNVPDEVVKAISDQTATGLVAELRRIGVIRDADDPLPPTVPGSSPESTGDSSTGSGQSTSGPGTGGETGDPPVAGGGTFASRFLKGLGG